jgi:hypothetical protein
LSPMSYVKFYLMEYRIDLANSCDTLNDMIFNHRFFRENRQIP